MEAILPSEDEKSFVEAIEEKYSCQDDDLDIVIFVPKSAPGQNDKGDIIVPQELSLEDFEISCAGDDEKIASLCGHITLLDLSYNRIRDWREIFKILCHMPKCAFLLLRSNPLSGTLEDHTVVYPCLEKLVLNELMLPWDTVVKLLQIFPNLKDLQLCLNGYKSVDIPEDLRYSTLKSLHFNCNGINQKEHLLRLGQVFPNLENLVFLQNPLTELPPSEEACKHFPNLKSFNISECAVSDWCEVEKLQHFPCLSDVRMQGLAFLKEYEEELRRQLILAYLPNITRLNGSSIEPSERDKAERAFLRHYTDQTEGQPLRYQELEAIHGKPEPLAKVNLTLKEHVSVTFKYNETEISKVISTKMPIGQLKKEIQKELGLTYSALRFWHEESDGVQTSVEEMTCNNLPVSRYDVKDGEVIMVDKAAPFSLTKINKSLKTSDNELSQGWQSCPVE